jgi:hypothetical protein
MGKESGMTALFSVVATVVCVRSVRVRPHNILLSEKVRGENKSNHPNLSPFI